MRMATEEPLHRADTASLRLRRRNRVPNPPAVFVGREDEAKQLATRLKRSSAVLVVGAPGLGKSSLVAHVLRRRFPKRVARTVVVSAPRDSSLVQFLLELVHALAEPGGWTH